MLSIKILKKQGTKREITIVTMNTHTKYIDISPKNLKMPYKSMTTTYRKIGRYPNVHNHIKKYSVSLVIRKIEIKPGYPPDGYN